MHLSDYSKLQRDYEFDNDFKIILPNEVYISINNATAAKEIVNEYLKGKSYEELLSNLDTITNYMFEHNENNMYYAFAESLDSQLAREFLVKKNPEYLCSEERIYKYISKEKLETLGLDREKVKRLVLVDGTYDFKKVMEDIKNYEEKSEYSDIDNSGVLRHIEFNSKRWAVQYSKRFGTNFEYDMLTKYKGRERYFNFLEHAKVTYTTWESEFSNDEFIFGFKFPAKVPLSAINKVKENLPNFKNMFEKYNSIRSSSDMAYQKMLSDSFLGLSIALDYFGIDKNSNQSIEDKDSQMNIFLDIMKDWDDKSWNVFVSIFSNLSYKFDKGLMLDLINNFSDIVNSIEFDSEYSLKEILERTEKVMHSKYDFESIDELIYTINNKDLPYILKPLESKFTDNYISKKNVEKLVESYKVAFKQEDRTLPFIQPFENDDFIYEAYHFWDIRTFLFDIENQYETIGIDNLCRCFEKTNMRVMVMIDKNTSEKSYIIMERTDDNVLKVNIFPEENESNNIINEVIKRVEDSLTQEDKIFEIEVNGNCIKQNEQANHQVEAKYKDGPFVITQRNDILDNLFSRIAYDAFALHGTGTSNTEASSHFGLNNEAIKRIYGKDWVIQYISNEQDHCSLDLVAKYDSGIAKLKTGMKEELKKLIDSHQTFGVAAHSTIYYSFVEMAAKGEIFILKDEQKTISHDAWGETGKETGVWYNPEKHSKNFSTKVVTKHMRGNNDYKGHQLKIKSIKHLTDEEKKQLEKQKQVYGMALQFLDINWEIVKIDADSSNDYHLQDIVIFKNKTDLEGKITELFQRIDNANFDDKVTSGLRERLTYFSAHNRFIRPEKMTSKAKLISSYENMEISETDLKEVSGIISATIQEKQGSKEKHITSDSIEDKGE